MTPSRRFQPRAWLELLERRGVQHIVVGGYGGTLHGARRPTADIDVVPRWEFDNLAALCDALREVHAVAATAPRLQGDQITPDALIVRRITTWATSLGRVDTMVGIPNDKGMPVGFLELRERAVVLPLADLEVPVASLDDIIVSKEFADRPKDAEALPELRRIRQERRRARHRVPTVEPPHRLNQPRPLGPSRPHPPGPEVSL